MHISAMPQSRKTAIKSAQFEKNVSKRGKVPASLKKQSKYPVGPMAIGLFVFLVIGSAVLQVFATTQRGGVF